MVQPRVHFEDFVLPLHWELRFQFLRFLTYEDEWREAFPKWILFTIDVLGQAVNKVDTSQKAACWVLVWKTNNFSRLFDNLAIDVNHFTDVLVGRLLAG